MSDNVIPLGNITRLDLPVSRILENAQYTLSDVVIIGWDNDKQLYFASSIAGGGEVLWLLEQAKKELLEAM